MVLRSLSVLPFLLLATLSASTITTTIEPSGYLPLAAAHAEGSLPEFADYPAKGKFKGKIAKAKITTAAAKMYRTAITEGAKAGPNFAGHYTITEWGCGAGCRAFAIVDANTGKVYTQSLYVVHSMQLDEALQDKPLLQYQRDSRLLIVTGSRNEEGEGQYFYKWENNRLVPVKTAFEVQG